MINLNKLLTLNTVNSDLNIITAISNILNRLNPDNLIEKSKHKILRKKKNANIESIKEYYIDNYNCIINNNNLTDEQKIIKVLNYFNRFNIFRNEFTFQELIIIDFYYPFTWNDDKWELFKNKIPSWLLFYKIKMTFWHYGYNNITLNQLINIYNLIKSFNISNDLIEKDFNIYLDCTNHNNKKGCSKHTETYLDTELAFILTYKNKHALTIGFNVMKKDDKFIFSIEQIQCKNKIQNRWIYKIDNYFETFINTIYNHFNKLFEIQLIKGETVVKQIFETYNNSKQSSLYYLNEDIKNNKYCNKNDKTDLNHNLEKYKYWCNKINSFINDSERIKKFYNQKINFTKINKKNYWKIIK